MLWLYAQRAIYTWRRTPMLMDVGTMSGVTAMAATRDVHPYGDGEQVRIHVPASSR